MDDLTHRHTYRLLLIVAAVFMLIFWHLIKRHKAPWRSALPFDIALVLLAMLSVFAYFQFGWLRYGQYMNPHDVFHYHMGAKYSNEHKYYDLYRDCLVADMEMNRRFKPTSIRNLDDHTYESVSGVLRDSQKYKAQFSPERWEEFKQDVLYWQSVMPGYKWDAVLRDKGYNATPVWNATARWITNHIPTSSVWGMRFLTYIDLICLVAMFAVLGFTFGWRLMLFAIIFHGTNFFMADVHIKGAFMRLDWLTTLVIAVCMLEQKRYKLAGGFAAFAGMARVFPFIFVFPLGVKALLNGLAWLRDSVRRPENPVRLDANYVGFFASLVVTAGVLFGYSVFCDGGLQLWHNFVEKIGVHNSDISTTRVGFKYLFLWEQANYAAYYESHKTLWNGIMAAVLLFTAFLSRRAGDVETLPLGFIPVFFLTSPTFYYYVMLLVPLLYFLPKIQQTGRLTGAILVFLASGVTTGLVLWLPSEWTQGNVFLFFFLASVVVMVLTAYLAFCASGVPALAANLVAPPEPEPEPQSKKRAEKKSTAPAEVPEPVPADTGRRAVIAFFVVAAILGVSAFGASQITKWVSQKAGTSAAPSPPPLASDTSNSSPDTVQLVFTGDVMLSRNVARSVARNGKDFTFPFLEVAPYIRNADIAFCNLESPISGRGVAIKKTYLFNAPRDAIRGLYYAGFDVVSLANNHILDYGPIAQDDTIGIVQGSGIQPLGITTKDEPQTAIIRSVKGLRIGYLAYCDPVPPYSYAKEFYVFDKRPASATPENLARDIAALRPKVDILVVSIHWGIEYQTEPDAHQRELGHYVIDQGADILAGHHQHVQQEPEVYKNRLILNGMGNFVFDQHTRPPTRESRLYRVYVKKDGIQSAEYLPLEITNLTWQPTPLKKDFVKVM